MNYPFAHEKRSLLKKKNTMFWKFHSVILNKRFFSTFSCLVNLILSHCQSQKTKFPASKYGSSWFFVLVCVFFLSPIDVQVEAIKSHSLPSKFTYSVRWIFHLFHSKESVTRASSFSDVLFQLWSYYQLKRDVFPLQQFEVLFQNPHYTKVLNKCNSYLYGSLHGTFTFHLKGI